MYPTVDSGLTITKSLFYLGYVVNVLVDIIFPQGQFCAFNIAAKTYLESVPVSTNRIGPQQSDQLLKTVCQFINSVGAVANWYWCEHVYRPGSAIVGNE